MSCGSVPDKSNRHLGRGPLLPRDDAHLRHLQDEGFCALHDLHRPGLLLFLLDFRKVTFNALVT